MYLPEQGFVINTVEAFCYISIEDPFGLLIDADIGGSNRIPGRASRSKSIAIRFKTSFPLRFERYVDQCLECSVEDGRDASRPLLVRCRFGYPDPSDGLRLLVQSQGVDQGQSLGRR